MIGDPELRLPTYGMLRRERGTPRSGRPAADMPTVRTVFVVGPARRSSCSSAIHEHGRNSDEMPASARFHVAHGQAQCGQRR